MNVSQNSNERLTIMGDVFACAHTDRQRTRYFSVSTDATHTEVFAHQVRSSSTTPHARVATRSSQNTRASAVRCPLAHATHHFPLSLRIVCVSAPVQQSLSRTTHTAHSAHRTCRHPPSPPTTMPSLAIRSRIGFPEHTLVLRPVRRAASPTATPQAHRTPRAKRPVRATPPLPHMLWLPHVHK